MKKEEQLQRHTRWGADNDVVFHFKVLSHSDFAVRICRSVAREALPFGVSVPSGRVSCRRCRGSTRASRAHLPPAERWLYTLPYHSVYCSLARPPPPSRLLRHENWASWPQIMPERKLEELEIKMIKSRFWLWFFSSTTVIFS